MLIDGADGLLPGSVTETLERMAVQLARIGSVVDELEGVDVPLTTERESLFSVVDLIEQAWAASGSGAPPEAGNAVITARPGTLVRALAGMLPETGGGASAARCTVSEALGIWTLSVPLAMSAKAAAESPAVWTARVVVRRHGGSVRWGVDGDLFATLQLPLTRATS